MFQWPGFILNRQREWDAAMMVAVCKFRFELHSGSLELYLWHHSGSVHCFYSQCSSPSFSFHSSTMAQHVTHTQMGQVSVHTNAEHEVVEWLVVDIHECDLHGQSKVCQVCQVLPALSVRLILLLPHQKTNTHTIIMLPGKTISILG